MQIFTSGDSLHEMLDPVFWEKVKYFNMSSTENFTQSVKL